MEGAAACLQLTRAEGSYRVTADSKFLGYIVASDARTLMCADTIARVHLPRLEGVD